jgi:hypothetical protein
MKKYYTCPRCKIVFDEEFNIIDKKDLDDKKLESKHCKSCNEYLMWELNKYN